MYRERERCKSNLRIISYEINFSLRTRQSTTENLVHPNVRLIKYKKYFFVIPNILIEVS